jgi:hypothetical protein
MKIKLSFPYPNWPIMRQFPGARPKWGNYEFAINPPENTDEKFDFWFVFNFPTIDSEKTICRKGSTVLITGEPESVEKYSAEYARQFAYVITSQRSLPHSNKFYWPQALPWFVGKSFDELTSIVGIEKIKPLSIITSTKTITKGHRLRLEFAQKIKKHYGDHVDLFGRGIRDFDNKWDVIAPYYYSIAIENTRCNSYFTEKLADCFLAKTFPFYHGCPNIQEFFPGQSLQSIDINNFGATIKTIDKIIDDPQHYSRSLSFLDISRNKVLFEYNLFPLIVRFIETEMRRVMAEPFEHCTLKTLTKPTSIKTRLKKIFLQ